MPITVTSIKPQDIETGCSLNGKILYEKTVFGTKVGGTDLELFIGNDIDFAYIYGGV